MPDKCYCIYCGTETDVQGICTNARCQHKNMRGMVKERKFCEYCGNRSVQGIVFCMSCGEHFHEIELNPALLTNDDISMNSNINLFKVDDEELARYSEDDEIDSSMISQKKLPSMGISAFIKSAMQISSSNGAEVEPEEIEPQEIEPQEDKSVIENERDMLDEPVKSVLPESIIVDNENEQLDVAKDTNVQANNAQGTSTFDTSIAAEEDVANDSTDEDNKQINRFSIFEKAENNSLKDYTDCVTSNIDVKQSEHSVCEAISKTFIPSQVCVGSYVYMAKPMSLQAKYKPVIPLAFTVGM